MCRWRRRPFAEEKRERKKKRGVAFLTFFCSFFQEKKQIFESFQSFFIFHFHTETSSSRLNRKERNGNLYQKEIGKYEYKYTNTGCNKIHTQISEFHTNKKSYLYRFPNSALISRHRVSNLESTIDFLQR